jgi:hypothetical protein
MKRTAIVVGSIVVAVLCLLGVGRYVARAIQTESALERKQTAEETQSKLREHDADIIEKTNKMLGEGGVFVMGGRVNKRDGQVENVLVVKPSSKEEAVVEVITWAVHTADYHRLIIGMSLEEVRAILDLSALRFIPNGASSRFVLVCRHGDVSVTLVFAGIPDVKLVSRSIN